MKSLKESLFDTDLVQKDIFDKEQLKKDIIEFYDVPKSSINLKKINNAIKSLLIRLDELSKYYDNLMIYPNKNKNSGFCLTYFNNGFWNEDEIRQEQGNVQYKKMAIGTHILSIKLNEDGQIYTYDADEDIWEE